MARLIIILGFALLCAAVVLLAARAFLDAARGVEATGQAVARRTSVQKIAYVALILLLFGVTTGLLGGL